MTSEAISDADARAMLHLPAEFELPDTESLVTDARAILLHTLSLRKELEPTGVLVSPIWENKDGNAAVRAAIVAPEITSRYFEGPGVASLRDGGVMEMLADIVLMLLEDPPSAAQMLSATDALWVSKDAPIRSLELPYKPYFKVLTLTIADLARKVGAGFTELEWIASLGLLDAYHDPSSDPPRDQVVASTAAKTATMMAEEDKWMQAILTEN